MGTRRIDALFYADDLALIASSRADLQRQLEITEEWLTECNMEMNVLKTEYLVLGDGTGGGLITKHGDRILPQQSATYLGYERRSNDTAIAHLKRRITQANKAQLNIRTILKRLPNLPINRQLQIANTCIRTVFLYGTEA